MDIGKVGIWFFLDAMPAADTAEFAKKIEKLGYRALWIPEAVGREPFAHAGYLLSHTDRLTIATGIANIWARDAMTMSAASKTVAEESGGRFILGIGVSHAPLVAGLRGHNYDKPYTYMKEYLAKTKGALYRAPAPKEPEVRRAQPVRPEDLAKAAAANSSSTEERAGPNRVAIRPLKKTYVKVVVDNEEMKPAFERWISPADGTVEFRGQRIAVRVLDRDAVQIKKNGKLVEEEDDDVTVE